MASISAAIIVTMSAQLSAPFAAETLATQQISLENRYPVKSVSDIFRDNILLNIAYLSGEVKSAQDINWDKIKKPFTYSFILEPGKTFAFHDDVSEQYKNNLVKTTNAHFNAQDGFKSDGYLYGDGVCHLASLIYWVAKDAGLEALAPTNHYFMAIPEISREYGVSIYSNPFSKGANTQQNLYVTNNKSKPVSFKFEYDGVNLQASVLEN